MIYSCWSIKGSSGVTTISTAMALSWARERDIEVLLVDLAGDIPSCLGLASSAPVGISDWLCSSENLESDSLKRLEIEVIPRLHLLSRGTKPLTELSQVLSPDALIHEISFQVSLFSSELIKFLSQDKRRVILDCGNLWDSALGAKDQNKSQYSDLLFRRSVAGAGDVSWIFLRACYLSLHKISGFSMRPDAIVLLKEVNRSLSSLDVSEIIGAPIALNIAADPLVMRAVDSGLLSSRLPRRLERLLAAQINSEQVNERI